MAPVELETICENSNGAAFEVKIKSPKGDSIRTPARERLESYGDSRLPHLLKSHPLPSTLQTPAKHRGDNMLFTPPMRAEKSRKHNEQIRKAKERVRSDLDKSTVARRLDLEEAQRKAAEKRQEALADRSTKAGNHFEAVLSKTEEMHQKFVEDAAARSEKLYKAQTQKNASHLASLAQRKARAEKHNEAVTGILQHHKETIARRAKDMREQECANKFSSMAQKLCEQNTCFGK